MCMDSSKTSSFCKDNIEQSWSKIDDVHHLSHRASDCGWTRLFKALGLQAPSQGRSENFLLYFLLQIAAEQVALCPA